MVSISYVDTETLILYLNTLDDILPLAGDTRP